MAGAGFKTFVAGQVLGATDVNTYLMQQSMMVFANAAAATTAIGTPTQGMVIYSTDDSRTYTYTGSVWKPNTPFVMEMISQSVTGSAAINFTAGRFTQTPIVLVSVASSANTATSVTFASNSTTGITAYVWTGTTAASVGRSVQVLAIQATSSTAAG